MLEQQNTAALPNLTTIAAIATPRGTGGVAIIRISGPQSWEIASRLSAKPMQWEPGRVLHGWLRDPVDGKLMDEVLFLPFKGPKSFTGEDCMEIHCHGGAVLSQTILKLCLAQGAMPAAAGEFTRRALLNGRIDLSQAESILDLIHAQGEALIKLSANNLHHRAVGNYLQQLLLEISRIQADLTASIDFPDEVDEPDRDVLAAQLRELATQLSERLSINRRNQVLREGIEVALIGRPNAGKSSVFNALLSSERSIVTDIPGTTRDVIRETLQVKGIPLTLTDTAGLRETADQVEMLGVERSWQAVASSQAIIYVLDGTTGLEERDRNVLETVKDSQGVIVLNKSDALGFNAQLAENPTGWPVISVSAQTGSGMGQLMDWLESLADTVPDVSGLDYLLSHRQMAHLEKVQGNLEEAEKTLISPVIPLDLATVPLTDALLELQGLLGKDTTELVLDSVFARFCVGK